MKIRHWSMLNGSGMFRVAESMAGGEAALGHDSRVVDCQASGEAWDEASLGQYSDLSRYRLGGGYLPGHPLHHAPDDEA